MAYNIQTHCHEATFGIGARVKVVRQRKYPSEKLIGLVGTVRTDSGTNVSVIFDDIRNPRSSYGCYYFKSIELELVEENNNTNMEDENMNNITNYLNTVKIKPINEPNVSYNYANFDADLSVGNLCVVTGLTDVRRASTALRGLSVAEVISIENYTDIKVDGEIVCKIDTTDYNNRVKCRIRAAELKTKMQERAKQLQDIALYQMLAKEDSSMMELLNEFQSLPQY